MPRISSFYGLVIWIYYDEIQHQERPHFPATYSGDEAAIAIDDMRVLAGGLPARGLGLVLEWARAHEAELRDNWSCARRGEPLQPIEPLR